MVPERALPRKHASSSVGLLRSAESTPLEGQASAAYTSLVEQTHPADVEAPTNSMRPTLAAAAFVVAAGFLGSRLLGLLRVYAISDTFGTSPELDAYWVAFRLPDLIFQMLAGAAMGAAFIPVFAKVLAQSQEQAWRLASSVLNLVALATFILAVFGFLLAPLLVPLLAPGLGEDSGRQAELHSLAVDLTQLMMLSPILFSISGMFMAILNARFNFFFPAIAPMVYNLAIIVGAFLFDDVRALAAAVVVGAALHLAVQLPGLFRVRMRYRLIALWRDSAVQQVGRLMAPRIVGLAAFQFNLIIMTFFASFVGDNTISALNFAWLIVMMPLGLFGMAISTAVFPTLAEQAVDRRDELRATLERSLRFIMFLTVPAALSLMILSQPLVALILEHGAFSEASTEITRDALIFFAIGLIGHAGIEILSRGFYALSDTRTPVLFAVVALLTNLVLSAIFVSPFGISGLALAISLATLLNAALLFWSLRGRLEGLDTRRIGGSLGRTFVAALLMAEVIGFYLILLHRAGYLDTSQLLDSFLAVAGSALLGGLVYMAAARALGSEELELLLRRLPWPRSTTL